MARRLAELTSVRAILPLGSMVVAASFATFALAHHQTWHIGLMMGVMGAGIGIAYSVMPALIVARTPPERTASATGINQVLRLMGGSLGAAVVTAIMSAYTPAGVLNPYEAGYVVSALVATVAGVLAAVVGYFLVDTPHVPAAAVSRETVDTRLNAG